MFPCGMLCVLSGIITVSTDFKTGFGNFKELFPLLDVALVGFDKEKEVEVDGGFPKSLAIVTDISCSSDIELNFFESHCTEYKGSTSFSSNFFFFNT